MPGTFVEDIEMANSQNDDFNNQGSGLGGASGSGSTGGFGNSGDLEGSAGYGTSGTGGFGSTSGASAGAGGLGGTSTGGTSGLKDRAANLSGTARERAGEFAGTAREKASELKSTLADKLEQGADKLRSRGGSSASFAGAAGDGSVAMENRADQLTSRLAGGMQGTAEWLREADLENMRVGIERQVRENPGRSLLVAVGLGYLLGKAFRR